MKCAHVCTYIGQGVDLGGSTHSFDNDTPLLGIYLEDLLLALIDVTVQWFNLGIQLDIPPETLKAIRTDRREVEECKREMLIKWDEQDTPTWEKLVKALIKIEMYFVAVDIATKHCE